jgi:ATP-dependent exoDNAse (exonuclease V) alpha subunit
LNFRSQFPLELAHASTIHACQGVTAKSPGGLVFLRNFQNKPLFAPGLCYVAISRCQSVRELLLRDPLGLQHFKVHENFLSTIKLEYDRLEQLFPQRLTSLELKKVNKDILRNCSSSNY